MTLEVGDVAVTLHPDAGGRIGQIAVAGRRFLRDHEPGERAWAMWGSYPLIPWSNRIADARFTFRGQEWELADRWVDGTAIHGLVCRQPWTVIDATGTSATLTIAVDTPPWTVSCEQRFELAAGALTQELSVTNRGGDDVPVGIGIHPWFRKGLVRVPADLVWPAVGCIPTGPPRPVTEHEDLRRPVDPAVMDSCYTGLTAPSARIGGIELSWIGPVENVVVYTGEPGWTCLEPVTNANDGFNLLDAGEPRSGVIVLPPGGTATVAYTFRWPGH